MLKKAKVIVTVHRNPVQAVSMDEAPASNIRFGDMTASHGRRDRRRTRRSRGRRDGFRSIARFS